MFKLGVALMRALGVKDDIDPNHLLPIQQPKQEQNTQEAYQALLAITKQWQPSPSEP